MGHCAMGLVLDSRRSKKGCFDVVSGPDLTFFHSEFSGEMTGVSLGGRALAPRGYGQKNHQCLQLWKMTSPRSEGFMHQDSTIVI
jgi:hypothetical protein